jgi:hypothetical protein
MRCKQLECWETDFQKIKKKSKTVVRVCFKQKIHCSSDCHATNGKSINLPLSGGGGGGNLKACHIGQKLHPPCKIKPFPSINAIYLQVKF